MQNSSSGNKDHNGVTSTVIQQKLDPIPRILFLDLYKGRRAVTVRLALKQLANICFDDGNNNTDNVQQQPEANRRSVCQLGGFSIVVGVMEKWSDNADIQAEACRVFLNTCSPTTSSRNIAEAACAVGALETILVAMRRFVDDAYLQRVACGALHALTKNDAVAARRLVLDLRGAFTVVRSMRHFPKSKRLQMWACCAIDDWAQWEVLHQWILDAGALVALDAVLVSYRDAGSVEDTAIQDKARSALRILS